MCLAIPAKVLAVSDDGNGMIEIGGVRKEVSLLLVDNVQPGDYVIIHVGFAIARLDEEEARKTLALFAEVAAAENTE